MKKIIISGVAATMLLTSITMSSCNKEYTNPATASTGSVTKNADALMNLCAGLQRRYSIGRQSPMYTVPISGAYSVFALNTLNAGNIAEAEIQTGKGAIALNNAIVTQLWQQNMLLKAEAETVLNSLNVANDAGDRVGIKAYGSIFYALSLGNLAQFFEQVPLVTEANAAFTPRIQALEKAIAVLESVDTDLTTTAPSAKFLLRVPAGIDARNTVKALLARYYNMHSMATGTYNAGSGNKAIAFANAASKTVKSEFRFSLVTPNPLGEANLTVNIYGAIDSTLGLRNGLAPNPAATDPRIGFYIARSGGIYPMKGFAELPTTSYPVYLPGEMSLIVAENNARQGGAQLAAAVTALNSVRQKTTDVFLVNAAQAAYSGPVTTADLLTEIYKQRRIELFLSGQELEDSRRFNRAAPNAAGEERNRTFYPYPLLERNNNTNTPADPTI